MTTTPPPHLAIIGDRVALGWVLDHQKIAFPEPRFTSQLPNFVVGNVLYLYTTRGCFKNPTRDKGRIIGKTILTGDLVTASKPLTVGNRTFPYEAPLQIESLTPVGTGIDVSEIVSQLSCFPKPASWSIYLRRSVVPISETDARIIDELLEPLTGTAEEHRRGYEDRARMGLLGNR